MFAEIPDCKFARFFRGYGDRHDIWGPAEQIEGQARYYGDWHDVRYTDQERATCNVQLSTFNGVTERAHGDRDMETDTAQIEGQTRYLGRATDF